MLATALVVHLDLLGSAASLVQLRLAQRASVLTVRAADAAERTPLDHDAWCPALLTPLAPREEWRTEASLYALCNATGRSALRVGYLVSDRIGGWVWDALLRGGGAVRATLGCVQFERVLSATELAAGRFDAVIASDVASLRGLRAPRGLVGFAPATGQRCREAAPPVVAWEWALLAQPSCAALQRARTRWLPMGARRPAALRLVASRAQLAASARPVWLGFAGAVTADRAGRAAAVSAARAACDGAVPRPRRCALGVLGPFLLAEAARSWLGAFLCMCLEPVKS